MASIDDIRTWGAENGFDVSGGTLPPGLLAAYNDQDNPSGERPPAVVKSTARGRVKEAVARAKAAPPVKKAVARIKARVSLEGLIGMAWNVASNVTANVNPAVSRVLEMQAPIAGMILEEQLKDTLADRLLQPIARAAESSQVVSALVGPPLLVAALSYRPDQAGKIVPLLRMALRSWVDVAGDKLERRMEQEKEFEEKYGKRIDEMIEWFMAPLAEGSDKVQWFGN